MVESLYVVRLVGSKYKPKYVQHQWGRGEWNGGIENGAVDLPVRSQEYKLGSTLFRLYIVEFRRGRKTTYGHRKEGSSKRLTVAVVGGLGRSKVRTEQVARHARPPRTACLG